MTATQRKRQRLDNWDVDLHEDRTCDHHDGCAEFGTHSVTTRVRGCPDIVQWMCRDHSLASVVDARLVRQAKVTRYEVAR